MVQAHMEPEAGQEPGHEQEGQGKLRTAMNAYRIWNLGFGGCV